MFDWAASFIRELLTFEFLNDLSSNMTNDIF